MENLIFETNARLQEIIDNLSTIRKEYTNKLASNSSEIETQLKTVDRYREEFFTSKRKIEKMNADIEGFEEDYKKLVERFQDDELANILVAANKEISAKIDERKRKILRDRQAMNELVGKAEEVKQRLVKLTAEKKALELCLARIEDSHEFYSKALSQVIDYSSKNQDDLCSCFHVKAEIKKPAKVEEAKEIEEVKLDSIEENTIPAVFEDDDFETEIIIDEKDIDIDEQKDDTKKKKKKKKKKKNPETREIKVEEIKEEPTEENHKVKKDTFEEEDMSSDLDDLNIDDIEEIAMEYINDNNKKEIELEEDLKNLIETTDDLED